jgi:hypothetical protein
MWLDVSQSQCECCEGGENVYPCHQINLDYTTYPIYSLITILTELSYLTDGRKARKKRKNIAENLLGRKAQNVSEEHLSRMAGCYIPNYLEFKTPPNLKCIPLLKRDFQGKKVCKRIHFTVHKIYYCFSKPLFLRGK